METLARGANRGSVSTGYDIDNSLKLEADNTEYLTITNTSTGSRRTATYSCWLKRTELLASGDMQVGGIFKTGETVRFFLENDQILLENGMDATKKRLFTNRKFRDTSAFYHFVVAIDTTQSTASNRVKLYVNGVQETSFAIEEYPDQNFDLAIGLSGVNNPWRWGAYNSTYYSTSGYLAECHYIDGTQYAASDFGEFDEDSGIWKPKAFIGTYGTQGSYLNFSDSSNLGANPKGSDIDAVLNNITAADQATDTPTNNFATWNVNYNYTNSNGNPTITEGATKTAEAAGGWTQAKATMGVTSGKWYWEYKMGGSVSFMGVQDDTASQTVFSGQYSLFLYNGDNTVEINDSGSNRDDTTLSYTFGTSVVYAVALNMDDNQISYYENGSIIGSAISLDGLANRLLLPYGGTNSSTNEVNFGGYTTMTIASAASDANDYGTFEYAPPTGYYALCTKNLAEFG